METVTEAVKFFIYLFFIFYFFFVRNRTDSKKTRRGFGRVLTDGINNYTTSYSSLAPSPPYFDCKKKKKKSGTIVKNLAISCLLNLVDKWQVIPLRPGNIKQKYIPS